ncbi:general secretion pathway protein GspK [Rhodoferax koreense]|uniref:Type II secretion system protein K n=2 Tax=Rhodoferax koreensis TaxID=1842727 RepID=A0A1P8JSW5_9BURK|nr:general secretion pathway protein GspK [Rhodoferax koreense]
MAMLTVTLVATFAAASLWQQWRSVEVETAERARVQSSWVLTGALDFARHILREDSRLNSGTIVDHLGEPWAVPLQESRLSTFLAADRNNTGAADDEIDAFLSGQIIDLQSRMNIINLLEGTKISKGSLDAFTRLFEQLNLPLQELSVMAENLRLAAAAGVLLTGTTPAASSSATSSENPTPLVPQRAEQLGWLGLSPATVAALQPFVTVLPMRTPVNLNTASIEVLQASIGIGRSDAQRLATTRARNPFNTREDARAQLGQDTTQLADTDFDVKSSFFEVQSRLRLGSNMVVERSLVRRGGGGNGTTVTTLWRERSATDPVAMALAAAR